MSGCFPSGCTCKCHVSQNDCCDQCKKNLDMMAELSMRINKMESSLMEFEKERIDPRFEKLETRIQDLEESYGNKND